jgi:hypothetical protein
MGRPVSGLHVELPRDVQSPRQHLQPREGDHEARERLRDYTNWFFENRNTCVGVRDDQVVDSYKKGLKDRKVVEKIHESGATKVAPLMEVVNKLINTEEALVNQFDQTISRTPAPLAPPVTPPRSFASDLRRYSQRTGADL